MNNLSIPCESPGICYTPSETSSTNSSTSSSPTSKPLSSLHLKQEKSKSSRRKRIPKSRRNSSINQQHYPSPPQSSPISSTVSPCVITMGLLRMHRLADTARNFFTLVTQRNAHSCKESSTCPPSSDNMGVDCIFNSTTSDTLNQYRHSLMQLVNQVELSWLNLSLTHTPLDYYTIVDSPNLTLCVFVLKKGQVMPLHDHPEMTVLSKIVHGDLLVKTYAPLNLQERRLVDKECLRKVLPCQRVISKVISGSSPESLLIIDSVQGDVGTPITNLHSFEAVSDFVVVLDVIGPPYNDERKCTFYREKEWEPLWSEQELQQISTEVMGALSSEMAALQLKSNTPSITRDNQSPCPSLSSTTTSTPSTCSFVPPEVCLLVEDPALECVCTPRKYQGLPVFTDERGCVVPLNRVVEKLKTKYQVAQ